MVRNARCTFISEARVYSKEEYSSLTPAQKCQVHELKLKSGWPDGRTPPPGFQVNEGTGEIEPTSQLISTIRAAIVGVAHYGQTHEQDSVGLLPPSHLVGDLVNGSSDNPDLVQLGSTFGRSGRRQPYSNNSTYLLSP